MTTDITELAQMKGQKVEGSYYLAECTDCGKMYPSNKLNGGEPLFSGDYGECYCPHCNADDAAIGDCGDTAATAWNYQQGRIDALVEALEKAQATEAHCNRGWIEAHEQEARAEAAEQRIAELEDAEQKLCAANVTLDARAELAERQLAELESRLNSADKLQDSAFRSGLQHGFSLGQTDDQKGYEHSMAAYSPAAGIREAE